MSSRIVLVTGGNTGLGYATILALLNSVKYDYKVILGARSPSKGLAAAEQLFKETTSPKVTRESIFVVQVDIEDENSVNKAYEVIKEKYGKIDMLINNAGTSITFSHLLSHLQSHTRPRSRHKPPHLVLCFKG